MVSEKARLHRNLSVALNFENGATILSVSNYEAIFA